MVSNVFISGKDLNMAAPWSGHKISPSCLKGKQVWQSWSNGDHLNLIARHASTTANMFSSLFNEL